MSLGLDALTDDQLVELVREIAAEMTRRSPAVVDAAPSAMQEEVAKATQTQDAQWARKKWLALMVTEAIGPRYTINVWVGKTGEVRVYLEDGEGREAQKWCYYVTGNSKHPPASSTVQKFPHVTGASSALVRIVCREAAAAYPGGVRIDCDQAAATAYDVPPPPAAWEARVAKEAAAKARAAALAKARSEFEVAARAETHAAVYALGSRLMQETGARETYYLMGDAGREYKAALAAANAALAERMAAYDAMQETVL